MSGKTTTLLKENFMFTFKFDKSFVESAIKASDPKETEVKVEIDVDLYQKKPDGSLVPIQELKVHP
jgi:hypothetical protein